MRQTGAVSTPETAVLRRAWGWVAALRDGDRTPWRDWHHEAAPAAERLPGAQQLELLRRLNQANPGGVGTALVDRVLTAEVPGRGRSDLPLCGLEGPGYGPAPVDPGELDAEELLRIAAGLLAEDLAATDLPQPVAPPRRPWAPSYQLAGDEWQRSHLRRALRRLARPEQHHPKRVFVLAADLATLLAHAWTARAFAESGAGWTRWLGRFVGDDRLPARADLPAIAGQWAAQIGAHRVVVVTEPSRLRRPLRLLRPDLSAPPPVTATGVDLTRRVSTTLGIAVPDEQRRRLLHEVLLPRLPQHPDATLAVPEQWHDWVRARAERMHADLLAAGYPVLGDVDRVVPLAPGSGADPVADDVLALALRLLADPAGEEETT